MGQQKQTSQYLILGLGQSGAATARWCVRQGWSVRLADTRLQFPGQAALRTALQQSSAARVQWALGDAALSPEVLEGIDVLVLSPGLSPLEPKVSALLELAEAKGIHCTNELNLFVQALASAAHEHNYTPQLIAITGTNGKTTVATMVAHMLTDYGEQVQLAGNISPSFLEAWMRILDRGDYPAVWVLECSSFQLHWLQSFAPDVATVLNIDQDHLDWHGSAQAYLQDKLRLLQQAKRIVTNAAEPELLRYGQALGKPGWTFSMSAPTQAAAVGICQQQGQAFDMFCLRNEQNQFSHLLPVRSLKVLGAHNVQNALAALALLGAAGWPVHEMAGALMDYQGEPYRCAWVRTVGAVQFINDSKGTNVGATVAAIEGMQGPKVLIAGGLAKGQDFAPLTLAVRAGQVRHCVLYGADAPLIAQALTEQGLPHTVVQTLQQAVPLAFELTGSADVVLFSPACASMDQFDSYMQRGQAFVDAVAELALDQGEVL